MHIARRRVTGIANLDDGVRNKAALWRASGAQHIHKLDSWHITVARELDLFLVNPKPFRTWFISCQAVFSCCLSGWD